MEFIVLEDYAIDPGEAREAVELTPRFRSSSPCQALATTGVHPCSN